MPHGTKKIGKRNIFKVKICIPYIFATFGFPRVEFEVFSNVLI